MQGAGPSAGPQEQEGRAATPGVQDCVLLRTHAPWMTWSPTWVEVACFAFSKAPTREAESQWQI